MNRRRFIEQLSALGAFVATPAISRSEAVSSKATEVFTFAVLNDLHHDSPECDPWFRKVSESVESLSPDLCVLAGDLANVGTLSSLKAVREIFNTLSCPVYTVPGNHDCDVPRDTSLYEEVFPGRLNYHIEHKGWQFVFLDTTDGKEWQNTRISDRSLDWLEKTVPSLDKTTPTLVFSHFPISPEIHMAPLNTKEVWKLLQKLNVRGVFCGHFHGQHAVVRPPLVTTNICCARPGVRGNFDGDPRKGFWLVTAQQGGESFEYVCKRIDV